jgi:hypothetical protein
VLGGWQLAHLSASKGPLPEMDLSLMSGGAETAGLWLLSKTDFGHFAVDRTCKLTNTTG